MTRSRIESKLREVLDQFPFGTRMRIQPEKVLTALANEIEQMITDALAEGSIAAREDQARLALESPINDEIKKGLVYDYRKNISMSGP